VAANDLEFRIGADIREIRTALADVNRQLGATKTAAQAAGSGAPLQGLQTGLQNVARIARQVVGLLAGAFAGRSFIQASEQVRELSARLRNAEQDQLAFNRAYAELFNIAQRNAAPLEETIELYIRFKEAARDLQGVTQDSLLQVVQTVQQAVELSGNSAGATRAALIQLSQGFVNGSIGAGELNRVMQQAPRLARALADGLDIPIERLKELGQEGQISADLIINALIKQRDIIAAEAENLPNTIGRATTRLGNSLRQLVGLFDETSGVTGGLADIINSLANTLGSSEVAGAIVRFTNLWKGAFLDTLDDVKNALTDLNEVTKRWGDGTEGAADIVARAFRLVTQAFVQFPVNIRAALQLAGVAVGRFTDQVKIEGTLWREIFTAAFTRGDTIEQAIERARVRLRAVNQAAADTRDDIFRERDQALAEAEQARQETITARESAQREINAGLVGTITRNIGGSADQFALIKDGAQRALRELDAIYRSAEIGLERYIERRTQLQLEAVEAEISAQRRELEKAQTADQRGRALTQIAILEREKVEIVNAAARDRVDIERDAQRQIEALQIRRLEQTGQVAEAAALRAEATYRDLIARLQAEGDQEGLNLLQNIIDADVLAAEISEAERLISDALLRLQTGEERIRTLAQIGAISQGTAERQAQELRRESVVVIEQQIEALERLAESSADPRVLQRLEQYRTRLIELQNQQSAVVERLKGAAESGLVSFFDSLANGARSAKEAIGELAASFLRAISRMAAEALAKRAILSLGGLFGNNAFGGAISALVAHSGAVVGGAGGTRRLVDPAIFFGAPRYHNGLSLAPDERPAILQTGEEVLARGDPRNSQNAGDGSGVRVVNIVDPGMVADYLNSAAGERVVMNVLGRNPGQVKQVLAG
jgi:tape measure domain-containing protein